MIYFLFFCASLVLAFLYGWFNGARWSKNAIERECNVKIEATYVITPETREALSAEANHIDATIDREDERKEL